MIFQVVSPFTASIGGDSFKEAIKNYIKLNRNLNINQMIVTDQTNHIQANIRRYEQDGRNRIGINMYPISTLPPIIVNNDSQFLPLSPTPVSSFFPLSISSPMSPIPMPFIPTVVNIPRGI